jgi:ribosome-associated translation inhibitor RaiA
VKIDIRFRGLQASPALRDHARERIRIQLDRFTREIRSVIVRITDVNGPRGGQDMTCLVTVSGRRFSTLALTETSDNGFAGINAAIDRAAQAVTRRIARSRR